MVCLSSLPSLFRFRFGRRLFHPVFFLWVCCLLGFGFCRDSFSIHIYNHGLHLIRTHAKLTVLFERSEFLIDTSQKKSLHACTRARVHACSTSLGLSVWYYVPYTYVSHISSAPKIRICRYVCLLYTSPSPRDLSTSRMPSSA